MQPGEIVVARLAKGIKVVRFLGGDEFSVELAVGRNKVAKLPISRVLLSTGILDLKGAIVEEFSMECSKESIKIDISRAWELIQGDFTPRDIHHIANLYWDYEITAVRLVSLLIHLESGTDHFVASNEGYVPRTSEEILEICNRKKEDEQNAQAELIFMENLNKGIIPETLSGTELSFLDDLRGYAVFGEDYHGCEMAKHLLKLRGNAEDDSRKNAFDLLVSVGIFSRDEHLELHRSGIPCDFPIEVLAETSTIKIHDVVGSNSRRDLTHLPTVTIDDFGTMDRDDAISFERVGAEYEEGYVVGIHITDVSSIIPKGSPMDLEASRRISTLYLPEGTVGMLPERVSNKMAGFNVGEECPARSVLVEFSQDNVMSGWEVVPSIVEIDESFSYESSDTALNDQRNIWYVALSNLEKISKVLRARREHSGALKIERSEMKVMVNQDKKIQVSKSLRSGRSRKLVEELMVLFNSILASFSVNENIPVLYRSQGGIDRDDPHSNSLISKDIATQIFDRYSVIKSLPPAQTGIVPMPHKGLGVKAYLQSTSPIRRYVDLVLQRQISQYCAKGEYVYSEEYLKSLGQRAEIQAREIFKLEDGRKRYWFLKYLEQSYICDVTSEKSRNFEVVVLENYLDRMALVELIEYPFRTRINLPVKSTPGSKALIELQEVDLWRRTAKFEYIESRQIN